MEKIVMIDVIIGFEGFRQSHESDIERLFTKLTNMSDCLNFQLGMKKLVKYMNEMRGLITNFNGICAHEYLVQNYPLYKQIHTFLMETRIIDKKFHTFWSIRSFYYESTHCDKFSGDCAEPSESESSESELSENDLSDNESSDSDLDLTQLEHCAVCFFDVCKHKTHKKKKKKQKKINLV